MSKPLELVIFPKLERPRTGAEIMPFREQFRTERELRLSKRLTDAELAAEYWKAAESVAFITAMGGTPIRAWRKLAILRRFATLPHHDETPGLTAHQEGTL